MRRGSSRGALWIAAALGMGATLLLSGCGEFFTPVNNSPGGSGTNSYVYVTNAGGTLAEYSLVSGVLTALSGSPITPTVAPTSIVVAPNNAFLYVGTSTGIFMYTIGSDGTLTEGNSDTVVYLNPNGYTVASMAVDPTSSWLLVAYQNQTELDAIPISPTTGLPTSDAAFVATLAFGTLAPQIAISQANNNVFIALGSGGTEAIGFTPTTTSSPWSKTGVKIPLKTANTSDTSVAVDPTSTYLYITEADISGKNAVGSLRLFAIANLGKELTGSPYPTGVGPSAVLAELSGSYVYVTNATDGTISAYSFSSTTQALTALASTFPTEKSPVALVEDSSKTYIIDVGSGANPNLWLYSIDATAADGTLDVGSTKSTGSVNPSAANGIAITH
jgi:6-phosphogluconolactonase